MLFLSEYQCISVNHDRKAIRLQNQCVSKPSVPPPAYLLQPLDTLRHFELHSSFYPSDSFRTVYKQLLTPIFSRRIQKWAASPLSTSTLTLSPLSHSPWLNSMPLHVWTGSDWLGVSLTSLFTPCTSILFYIVLSKTLRCHEVKQASAPMSSATLSSC